MEFNGAGAEDAGETGCPPGTNGLSINGGDPDRADVIEELVNRIRAKLRSNFPEAVQCELAALLGLVPEASGSNSLCLCQFKLAVDALLSKPPKLDLARGLRMKFEEEMWSNRFGGWFVKALPTTRVVLGLFVTAGVLAPWLIWATFAHFGAKEGVHSKLMDPDFLVLVCCFGAFGAVTSIMVRLRSFDSIHAPPFTMFLTGLFKPFIGAFFAAFALVLIQAGFINFPHESLVYIALAIGFVAGFSERFGEDLTTVVMDKVPASAPRPNRGAEAAT